MFKAATDSDFVPAGHTLYFVRGAGRVIYKIGHDGSCLVGSYTVETLRKLACDPNAVWLFDPAEAGKSGAVPFGAETPDVRGHVIMAASTNARHFCDNRKAGDPLTQALFFPDYSEADAKVVFDGLLPPEVITGAEMGPFADRFRLVGGNLRLLLDCSMSLQQLTSYVHETVHEANVSHLLTLVHGNQVSCVTKLWKLAPLTTALLVKVPVTVRFTL